MLAPPRSAPLVRPVSPKRNLLRHERQSGVRDRRRWACRPAPEPSDSAVIYTEEQGFLRERITGSRCAAVVAQPALASPRVPYPPVPSWLIRMAASGYASPRLGSLPSKCNRSSTTSLRRRKVTPRRCRALSWRPVTVSLRPGREWLARQIDTTYGSKLAIFIGLTTWDGAPGGAGMRDLQTPTALPRGLRLSLRLGNTSVTSGADFSGSVRLAELGPGGSRWTWPTSPSRRGPDRHTKGGGRVQRRYRRDRLPGQPGARRVQESCRHRRDSALRRWDRLCTSRGHLQRRGPDQQ